MFAVYNTCGISGRDNTDKYIESIYSLLNQDIKVPIVLSSCLNKDEHIDKLRKEFDSSIYYSLINEKHTVNITFNKTVIEYTKRFGNDNVLYIDSGCIAKQTDTLSYMNQFDYGMVTCYTDTDQGFWAWIPQPLRNTIVPIGNSCNLHFQIFHKNIFTRFGRVIPDIFKTFCTESTFPFINAAINREWIILTERTVTHSHGMDGASSGFGGNPGWWDLLPGARPAIEMINDPEGTECGFGYEECGRVKMHNPDAYEGNFCKDPERLAIFLQNNIFLSKDVLNYGGIKCEWI